MQLFQKEKLLLQNALKMDGIWQAPHLQVEQGAINHCIVERWESQAIIEKNEQTEAVKEIEVKNRYHQHSQIGSEGITCVKEAEGASHGCADASRVAAQPRLWETFQRSLKQEAAEREK